MSEKRQALQALKDKIYILWTTEDDAEIRCLLWTCVAALNTITRLLRKAERVKAVADGR